MQARETSATTDRRSFLQSAAIVSGATALFGWLAWAELEQPGPSRVHRWFPQFPAPRELWVVPAAGNEGYDLLARRAEALSTSLMQTAPARPSILKSWAIVPSTTMVGMSENVFINIKNRSHSITADVEVPEGGGNGKGGTVTMLVNGEKAASGRVERTQPMIFSADETAGVGVDDATPVTTDCKERDNAFTGKILKVTVDVQPVGAAVRAEADSAQRMAAIKKDLSD